MRFRRAVWALLAGIALAATACSAPAPPPAGAVLRAPTAPTTVLDHADPAALAAATSAALFERSPVAVLAPDGDGAARAEAAGAAETAGVPMLLTPAAGGGRAGAGGDPAGGDPAGGDPAGGDPAGGDPAGGDSAGGDSAGVDPAGVRGELDRLGAGTVLAVGDAAVDWANGTVRPDGSARTVVDDRGELPPLAAAPGPPVLVLVTDAGSAAAATALAAGARVETVPDADPRADPDLLGIARPEHVLALGARFGPVERLDARLAVAASGAELPGGGQVLFPARRMVALYGHPGAPALGALGEQPVDAAVRRAQALAAEYEPFSAEPVVPAFEIIATVADSGPGPDGDYSAESTVEFLRPWVDAAGAAGVYVVLDLQPGRTDFRTQAQRYTELLARPHVGLALDPEWRLGPDQQHLQQIGTVGIDEVNAVVTWLADLTRDRALPQKLLLLHQFRTSMISGRERLDTTRGELAIMIHVDGFGPPGDKLETWNTLRAGAPAGVWWGWKNFYDEDSPTFTPQQTMGIAPEPPVFVSYQ